MIYSWSLLRDRWTKSKNLRARLIHIVRILEHLRAPPSSFSPSVGLWFLLLSSLFCSSPEDLTPSSLSAKPCFLPACVLASPHCHFFSAFLRNSCISNFSQVINLLFLFVLFCCRYRSCIVSGSPLPTTSLEGWAILGDYHPYGGLRAFLYFQYMDNSFPFVLTS